MSDVKTPGLWDADYTKLWKDYQSAQERIVNYRKEIKQLQSQLTGMREVVEAASILNNLDIGSDFSESYENLNKTLKSYKEALEVDGE